MAKRKIVFLILLATLVVGLALGQNWERGSFEDAQAKAKTSGKFLLLDFFQEYG
jgi:hypothetical protein